MAARSRPRSRAPVLGDVPPRLGQWGMDALYTALLVVLVPYALVRLLREQKTRARWRAYRPAGAARVGRRPPRRPGGPCVWVHGVSVGEVKSAIPLVRRLESAFPSLAFVVTANTRTGRETAEAAFPGHRVEFYPPDYSWIVKAAYRALRPDLVILVESGIWPNFLSVAGERGVPVVLVNARIGAGSARTFRALGGLFRPVARAFREVCVQVPAYAERWAALGVDEARLHVTGNMKFDNAPALSPDPRREALARLLGAAAAPPLLVAGSTHPDEERTLARLRARLVASGLAFRLVVAPRHPGRADAVEAQLVRDGHAVVRRSRLGAGPPPPDAVFLLDTMGELEAAYAAADLVFVGGTLVPHGGQNVIEPASLGRPVVVGPYVTNFRREVELLQQVGGIRLVPDEDGLERVLVAWLGDPAAARAEGERARAAILAGRGATERTVEILRPLLERAAATRV